MSIAELVVDRDDQNVYRVESILKDGACEVAVFSGANAYLRARAFASSPDCWYDDWKDGVDWQGPDPEIEL